MKLNDHRWLRVKRDRALIMQDGRCLYCRTHLSRQNATADHRQAKSRGGTDSSQIDATCKFCNSAKGTMSSSAFKKLLRGDGCLSWPANLCRSSRRVNLEGDRAVKRIRRLIDAGAA